MTRILEMAAEFRRRRVFLFLLPSLLGVFFLLLPASSAQAQDCIPAPPGIEGWWDADNVFDTIICRNITSSGANGILQNGVTLAPGQVGLAFSFDGVNDDFVCPSGDFQYTEELTIEFWVRSTGPQNQTTVSLTTKEHGPDNTGWVIQGGGASGRMTFSVGTGTAYLGVTSTTSVLDGRFHHIAAVFDSNLATDNIKIYVNGVLEATRTTADLLAPNTRLVRIGSGLGGTSRFFRGLIDEFSIYGRALTSQEIEEIVSAGCAGKCGADHRGPTQTLIPIPGDPATGFFGQSVVCDATQLLVGRAEGPFAALDASVHVFNLVGATWQPSEIVAVPAPFGFTTPALALEGDLCLVGWGQLGFSVLERTGGTWQVEGSVTGPNNTFFGAVALSGDRVVVGDHLLTSPGGITYGAANVYRHDGPGVWVLEQELLAEAPQSLRYFGNSVAFDGDTLLIGAPGDDQGALNAGAVYVFRRTGMTWIQEQKILPWDPGSNGSLANEYFGMFLACRAGTVLVGSSQQESDPPGVGGEAGVAHVLRYDGMSYVPEARLKPTSLQAGDRLGGLLVGQMTFGSPVSLDPTGTVAVLGAFNSDAIDRFGSPARERGSAYVFRRVDRGSGPEWLEVAELHPSNPSNEMSAGLVTATNGTKAFMGAPGLNSFVNRVYAFDIPPAATPNHRPVADAGPDQDVGELTLVQLDGTGSFDPELDPLSYSWAQLQGPPVLFDPNDPAPTFLAPDVDPSGVQLVFELLVDDGRCPSSASLTRVDVSNVNHPPVADAGIDVETARLLSTVQLDGTASSDPDLDGLGFFWTLTRRPDGSAAALDDPSLSSPQFVVDAPGLYEFELVVTDNIGLMSAPDRVRVSTEILDYPEIRPLRKGNRPRRPGRFP